MAYIPSYTAGDVAKMPADIAGTALVATKSYVPLAVGGLVGFGLYKHFKTKSKQWKAIPRMSKARIAKLKPWGLF